MYIQVRCGNCGRPVRIEALVGIQKGICDCNMVVKQEFFEDPVQKPEEPVKEPEVSEPVPQGETISEHYEGKDKPRPFILGDKRQQQ